MFLKVFKFAVFKKKNVKNGKTFLERMNPRLWTETSRYKMGKSEFFDDVFV